MAAIVFSHSVLTPTVRRVVAVLTAAALLVAVAPSQPAVAADSLTDFYPAREFVPFGVYADLDRDPVAGWLWATEPTRDQVVALDATGTVVRSIGSTGSAADELNFPTALAIRATPTGSHLFIADGNNHRVQVFDTSGNPIRSIGSAGAGPGQFEFPCALEVSGNRLYVADFERVQVFTLAGVYLDQMGEAGSGDGELGLGRACSGLAVAAGEVYVSDAGNGVVVFGLDGTWKRNIGAGTLRLPGDIEIDALGMVWVTDALNDTVTHWSPAGDLLGTGGSSGSGPGEFDSPTALEVDPTGETLWVFDSGNSRIQEITRARCQGEVVTHSGSSFADTFETGAGTQIVALGAGDDNIETGDGEDLVCGGLGDDQIDLGAGDDYAFGQGGEDMIDGGDGADVIFGQGGEDMIDGGTGNDILRGGAHADRVTGGGGIDRVFGNAGEDMIHGGTGNDILRGQANNDVIIGAAGNDRVIGGGGRDTHNGGAGRDVCLEGAIQGLPEIYISCENRP